MKIIGLTGEPGAGKDIVTDYLVNQKKFIRYRFSGILKNILDCLNLPYDRKNCIDLAVGLRNKFGNAILAKVLIKSLIEDNPSCAVINGLRYPEELEAIKEFINNSNNNSNTKIEFQLWYITANPEIRYSRLKCRTEKANDQTLTWNQFLSDENAETEVGIKELAKQANFTIINDEPLTVMYNSIENFLKHL